METPRRLWDFNQATKLRIEKKNGIPPNPHISVYHVKENIATYLDVFCASTVLPFSDKHKSDLLVTLLYGNI